jgi:S-(hydroxymethyl)glutathione dehydrogenase/alcohol dehydrogenase
VKAAVLRERNGKSVIEDVDIAPPDAGQVKIQVKAAGVCHSDLSFQNGTVPLPLPVILGHEGAGVISEVGAGVTSVSEGDHVIINWTPFCGKCQNCRMGRTNLCLAAGMSGAAKLTTASGPVTGAAGAGTFAEEMVMPENGVIAIPKDVPLELGCLISCGVMTGVGAAMNTAQVRPGSTVVVFGCGGVGINVIQGAKICGASAIVAVDKFESKLEMAKRFGATHTATPDNLPAVSQEVTGGVGFDYAFEVIGLSLTIRAAYDAVRRGGTAVIVGMGKFDDFVQLSAFEIFFSEKKLLGSYYGGANVSVDFQRLINLWKGGQLDLEGLLTRRITLDQVDEGFAAMERGDVIRQVITL